MSYDSMTLELKKNYVLINDLQYIYKHKHIFNNTQCKIHNRHIYHNTGHSIMQMVHWGENWAVLNKQMARWNASVHTMQNTVASVITVSTSMDFEQKAHILHICTDQN